MKDLLPASASPEAIADLQYAMSLFESGRRDPAFEKKMEAKTEAIRQQMLAEHGCSETAVQLIREGRDEE